MPSTQLRLPVARLTQLKALAQANGETVAEAIERLIGTAIAVGTIADFVPGFEVTQRSNAVVFRIDRVELPPISTTTAARLAEAMVNIAGDPQDKGKTLTIPGAGKLLVARVGVGFSIAYSVGGVVVARSTATGAILRDIARNLTEAALRSMH